MKDQTNNVKGPQQHAEGQHGERTHARFQEQLHESPASEADNVIASHREGKHRLEEGREQHDEADLQQDRNRLDRKRDDRDRG